mmetsp:Transcript_50193/g.162516  ORF Transcript_50193/g.162516 Transcript_50193/m.162516 type:complete len:182 (+) Transcript_50193:74-619(+)
MGIIWVNLRRRLFCVGDCRILMLGLDAAGKTTALYKLKLGEVVTTIPTVGFNVESLVYGSLELTVWDCGGQERLRPIWRHYAEGTRALVFVVDSGDAERLEEARGSLLHFVNQDILAAVPLLVIANKQDLPHALTVAELTERLGLHNFTDRQWYVQAASAHTGFGLHEGFDWLVSALAPPG